MTKLNQIVAVVAGKKTKAQKELTELYQRCQKPELFNGLARNYQPLDDEGETQPPEYKTVQNNVMHFLREAASVFRELIDCIYVQDVNNCLAVADIVVDGKTIATKVPVTHLLFLEKQLVDLHTFVSKLPVLDPSDEWEFDTNKNCFATKVVRTNRTKKVMRNHVKAEATDKHPAQVEVYTEDVKVGEWHTVKLSGAMQVKLKHEILERVVKLQEAVKFARETANNLDVKDVKISDQLLSYVITGA